MKFRVQLYCAVRLPAVEIEASSQEDAVAIAERQRDLEDSLLQKLAEDEECASLGALVDEDGDHEYLRSRYHQCGGAENYLTPDSQITGYHQHIRRTPPKPEAQRVEGSSMNLLNFVVLYRTAEMMPIEAPMCFQSWAEDSDHAEEQCRNAYPECDVVWVWQGREEVGVQPAFDDYWNGLQLVKPDQIVSREFHVTWDIDVPAENHAEAAKLALGIQRNQSSIATVFKVSDGTSTMRVDVQEGSAVLVEDERELSPQERLQQLVAEIQEKLDKARALAVEPFTLKLGETVDVAITPAVGHDDRVMVGREGWGFTLVNYTSEGLVLDVLSNTQPEPVWSGALYHDVLMA